MDSYVYYDKDLFIEGKIPAPGMVRPLMRV